MTLDLNAIQTMVRGDLDVTGTAHQQHALVMEIAPEVISIGSLDLFKGFIYIGRSKEWTTIMDLTAEKGPEKVRTQRLNEMGGKTFIIMHAFKPIVLDTVAQIGLLEGSCKLLYKNCSRTR